MRLRVYTCIMVLLVLLAVWATGAAAGNMVIWYLPHPDDETLGMADSIYQSVLAGNDNLFIYFSKGTGSMARFSLTGPDGQKHTLTTEEFGQARAAEALAALAVLGIRPDQVTFLDYQDGNIPQKDAEAIMRTMAKLYPGSIHCTVHILDLHPDHQTLAKALATVAREDGIEISAQFFHVYVYRSQLPMDQLNKKPVLYPEIKEKAIDEFGRWEPEQNRYAIGMASTPDLFHAARSSLYEYVDPDIGAIMDSKPIASYLALSTADAGYHLSIGQNLSLICALELKNSDLQMGIAYRLKTNLPLVKLAVGAGYHFGCKRPYGTVSAEITDYLIVTVKHVYKTGTRITAGIKVQLF